VSVLDAHPATADQQASDVRSSYWLKHSEGFQVFGPGGRIGFVALVLSADDGVSGLVIRTGLFRTQSVFVPIHQVGSVVARRKRLELLITPRPARRRISDLARELLTPSAESLPRDDAAPVPIASEGRAEVAT